MPEYYIVYAPTVQPVSIQSYADVGTGLSYVTVQYCVDACSM